jgi:hypothetical protein
MLTRKQATWLFGVPAVLIACALLWSKGLSPGRKKGETEGGFFSKDLSEPDLDQRMEASRIRLKIKREVIRQLVRGQLTLAEAAARFEEVDELDPDARGKCQLLFPARSPEESRYRQVIYWTECQGQDEFPDKVDQIVFRLEKEMKRLEKAPRPFPRSDSGLRSAQQ